MKVLVTGVNGQLGYDCVRELKKREYETIGVDKNEMDITDYTAVEKFITTVKPDVVIHCAAYTEVDLAEEEKQEVVHTVNAVGTENIAKVCKIVDCKMLYMSTDYIFNGEGTSPWKADCQDTNPINIYGQSKLDGEKAVTANLTKYFIVRISWAFGINGNNFINAMLEIAKKHDEIKVVNDQIGTPTYTADLARLLVDMIETEKYGFYNATNEGGYISWYDFSKEIFKQAGYTTKVIPVTTEQYGESKAKRPANSRLDKSKLIECGFKPLPTWKDALSRYLNEMKRKKLL